MIRYFTKIRLQYYLGGLAGVLVIFMLFATTSKTVGAETIVTPLLPFGLNLGDPTLMNILPLVLMAAWVFAWRYICGAKAKKQLYAILDILLNDCNPQAFIESLRPLLPKKANKNKRFIYLRLLLCTGLIEAGEFEEAKELLNGFDNFPKGTAGSGYKFTYYNNRFRYYHHLGQLEDCSDTLMRMKEVLSKSNFSIPMFRVYDSAYDQKRALYRMETGDSAEAEEVYTRMFANARHEIDRINARLILGRVALQNGKDAEARQDFEYVVQKGGLTIEVQYAREFLEKMGAQVSSELSPETPV